MPNSQHQIDLISHCIQFMSDKDVIRPFLRQHGIKAPKSYSYKKLALSYENNPDTLTVDDICAEFRRIWTPCDVDRHIAHLTSGLLAGHDWRGARPSMLHLSFQDKVRDCCEGRISLEEYLSLGSDIVKHEYFMVASHDICETSIIQEFPSVIPPIGSKSVTDFVFDGIPYDLKITSHPAEWKLKAGQMSIDDKKELAFQLYEGADSERMRAVAEDCKNNWGLNRMYYVVNDQNKWLDDPMGVVRYLIDNLCDTSNYFDIEVHGYTIHICLIEQ